MTFAEITPRVRARARVGASLEGFAERLIAAARAGMPHEAGALLEHGFSPFRRLLESTEDAVFLKDPGGAYLFINRPGARLLGKTVEQVIGHDDRALFGDVVGGRVMERDRELLDARRVCTLHEVFELEGNERHLISTRGPYVDREGEPVGVFGISRDVTELDRIATERLRLVEELTRAVRAREDFLSVASHELKTPISALQLLVETASWKANGKGTAEERLEVVTAKLAQVQQQATKLNRLVEQLLDVSRVAAGKIDLQPESVNLAAIVKETIELHRLELEQAGCALTVELPSELTGRFDALRVEQVFANLLMNAAKYGAGKPITVTLTHEEGCAVLCVQDHGKGIRPEDQAKIFERFERVGEDQREVNGFGLGLWIVRQIVEAHGGALSVQSVLGEGSTFTVVLPTSGGSTRGA